MQAYVIPINSSSSDELHHVEVAFLDGGEISINCSCTGSQMGTLCKHRLAIIRGDDSLIATAGHKELYSQIHRAFGNTALKGHFDQYNAQIYLFEVEKKTIAAKVISTKKQFAKMLSEGI